jgi:hypothetical protein
VCERWCLKWLPFHHGDWLQNIWTLARVPCFQWWSNICGGDVSKICSSRINDRTEIRTDCIISGPSVHGRGWELKKVTGGKYWCHEGDLVTKWQHGVGGGKTSPQSKNCSSKISCEDGAYFFNTWYHPPIIPSNILKNVWMINLLWLVIQVEI